MGTDLKYKLESMCQNVALVPQNWESCSSGVGSAGLTGGLGCGQPVTSGSALILGCCEGRGIWALWTS